MEAGPPCCVGLVGDGDDLAVIEHIEEIFGVVLDAEDAPGWNTAGDLFASLIRQLPADAASDRATWNRFAEALAWETGIAPSLIVKDSPLLLPDRGFWAGVREVWVALPVVWLALLLLAVLF